MHAPWQSVAHGLIAKGDWRHFRKRFADDDLFDHPSVERWRQVLRWTLRYGMTPLVWVLAAAAGLRWSPRRWGRSVRALWHQRWAKLRRRQGLEIGFAGVDGSGKSSTVAALAASSLPTKVLYMGGAPGHRYRPRGGQGWIPGSGPWLDLCGGFGVAPAHRYGLGTARAGWSYMTGTRRVAPNARRTACSMGSTPPLRAVSERPVDLSVFLDGDVEAFWRRKGEHTPEVLGRLRAAVEVGYAGRQPTRIDTVALPQNQVVARIRDDLFQRYRRQLAAP